MMLSASMEVGKCLSRIAGKADEPSKCRRSGEKHRNVYVCAIKCSKGGWNVIKTVVLENYRWPILIVHLLAERSLAKGICMLCPTVLTTILFHHPELCS